MNTFGERMPVAFDHGKGVMLYDTEGKEYLDFFAGIATNSLGYAHEKVMNAMIEQVKQIDITMANVGYKPKKVKKIATEFSVATAQTLFNNWVNLDKYLMVKYIDGNVKGEDENGFIDNGNGLDIPGKIEQPGYTEHWKRAVAKDKGEILKVVK